MKGVYVATATMTITTAKTLLLLEVPSTKVLEVRKISVTNTDVDSAEQIDIGLHRVTTKGTPAGTAVTPEKTDNGDQASGVTATANLTAEPTAYGSVALDRAGVSNLIGYIRTFDDLEITVPPSGLIGIRSMTTIASTIVCVMVEFREIG